MEIPFDITQPASFSLQTKNLNCIYEQGSLRYIKYGNTELVRMIYGAVRDSNWGTLPLSIYNENVVQYSNSFMVHYTARYSGNGIEFEASFFIEGNEDDTIFFGMEGKALNSFSANRIGLCVHLPVKECAGIPVTVTHLQGATTLTHFPENISPHQPFSKIEQLYWTTANNTDVRLSFAGEVFEAEDQRNWMDYSYKIYSHPLELPFPFEVNAGEAMKQNIRLSVGVKKNKDAATTVLDTETAKVPAIGIAAADETALLTTGEMALLQSVPFAHYRAELDFEKDWQSLFAIHCANAKSIGAVLELILFFTNNYPEEINKFITTISCEVYDIQSILPLHKSYKVTPPFLQEYFYPLIKKTFPQIMVGYGTDIYFAELNRQRPQNDLFDFISFSLNPQVHNFDEKTMLENLNTIPDIVATIRHFTDKPIFVSPVTFKKRKNHDGAGLTRHDVVADFDERQNTLFGVGWFLLCLYALHDAQQITFFKTTGDSGIVNPDVVTPLFQVLEQLKAFIPLEMKKVFSDEATEIVFSNKEGELLEFSLGEMYSM